MLNRDHRPRLRAAASIQQRLTAHQPQPETISLPDGTWQECQRLARKIRKADAHGWFRASRKLRERLPVVLRTLRDRIDEVLQQLPAVADPFAGSQRQIYDDLLALEQEFCDVRIDSKQQQMQVTTESIELDGVYLGPFTIALDWRYLGESCPYEVIADDPQPAAASDDVTHPHVHDNRLCEGEGRVPIRRALEQGRLFDFFLVVRQLLETYNSSSAYVALDRWNGVECHDCGQSVNEDERTMCESCERQVCDDCSQSCTDCGKEFCSGCMSRCEGCDEMTCHDCLSTSAGDGQDLCSECAAHATCST